MVNHTPTLGSKSKVDRVATSDQVNNSQTAANSTASISKKDTKTTNNVNTSGRSQKRKIDAVDSSEAKKTKSGSATKKSKNDHASTHQDSSVQSVKALSELRKRFTIPWNALWLEGRQSETSLISYATWEREDYDNTARLRTIKHEQDGMFTCHISVQMTNTKVSCVGYCKIPVGDMDGDIAGYFRTRTKRVKGQKQTKKEKRANGEFDIEEVSMGTTFEDLSGIVRLGRVIGEDFILDSYTLEAESAHPAATVAWRGEVYVPKERVPEYKLVNHTGKRVSVASTETVSEETKADEEALEGSCTVSFSRPVQVGGVDRMPASFWMPDGEACIESDEAHIVAYPLDDEHIEMHIRVRQDDETWWHMHGSMHKELTNGRFVLVPEAFTNHQSDVFFAWHLDTNSLNDTA